MESEQKGILDGKTHTNWLNLPNGFWDDWNSTCSEIQEYFKKEKEKREKKLSGKIPRYRDSHSLYY